MKTYKLSFGEISILNPKLAEVIINEGVIMDVDIVVDYHKFLMDHLEAPFTLLVNKKHSYTYTFEAQKNIVNHDVTKAIAVVNRVYASKLATDVLININRESKWNIKTFREREEALKWLEEQA
ncbi:DUF7793 family protein [Winogradskyella arenosi]|uniref:DUF7793 domain-containing protein n=1 Tax=Winogradskyella arenosi TaxID=533325 RepID=A0A368ZEK9_9FLAO|nr:hypothetical protein [Winogradskyella arenosi]RCW90012.1 hypothetical protein DFQ08_106119 [Winogradskyella arenosi]